MTFRASPPNAFLRSRDDVAGRERSIACRVPFVGDLRGERRERVRLGHAATDAEWATRSARHSQVGRRHPDVVVGHRTAPPRRPRRIRHDVVGALSVLHRVPLGRDIGRDGAKRVRDRHRDVGAKRTARAVRRARVRRRAPLVIGTVRALPPNAPRRTERDVFGSEMSVSRRVPLRDERRIPGHPMSRARHDSDVVDSCCARRRAARASIHLCTSTSIGG